MEANYNRMIPLWIMEHNLHQFTSAHQLKISHQDLNMNTPAKDLERLKDSYSKVETNLYP